LVGKLELQARATANAADASLKSALATERSADATYKQSEAMIREQRAWLLIEDLSITGFDWTTSIQKHIRFNFSINNYGKTPAFVFACDIGFELGSSKEFPPSSEVFAPQDANVNDHVIPQADKRPTSVFLRGDGEMNLDQFLDFAEMRKFVWAYGCVKYRDIHGSPHETRICFRYDFTTKQLSIDGPKEYNNAT